MQSITPCLWFDNNAEEAVNFYASIFEDLKILKVSRFGEAGFELHGKKPGTAMTIEFELKGQKFTALNGGPMFKFTEAISFQVGCDTQEEIDRYWDKLSEGGDPSAQQCGWLKDKFGLSWQIVPNVLGDLMTGSDAQERVMEALLQMKKLDIEALKKAHAG
ncbi:MAG: VOC family protein [Candidatus Omnitrophica bacterium]|nr:VOC family protein [Candidatus Omnitrophota bacterium]MCA9438586.1 VOC family protein [Candidatus Omnitrophota bacterium]MCA9445436.1 VOC family protein [Candidatus Omnitrophota bacterium]